MNSLCKRIIFPKQTKLRKHQTKRRRPSNIEKRSNKCTKNANPRKAPGSDEVPSDLLKLLEDKGINLLVGLYNTVYKTGVIPEQWPAFMFIILIKNNTVKHYSDYRTIAPMNHTLKLFEKISQKDLHNIRK